MGATWDYLVVMWRDFSLVDSMEVRDVASILPLQQHFNITLFAFIQ